MLTRVTGPNACDNKYIRVLEFSRTKQRSYNCNLYFICLKMNSVVRRWNEIALVFVCNLERYPPFIVFTLEIRKVIRYSISV